MSTLTLTAFLVSDHTGLTAEALGRSLLTQFSQLTPTIITKRFICTPEKAHAVVSEINDAAEASVLLPLVFSTVVNPKINEIIKMARAKHIDFFAPFLQDIAAHIKISPDYRPGQSHALGDHEAYMNRIEAINFSLNHDDGQTVQKLDKSDIILLGVSRTGKTPTSLYLSMHYGLRVANFPITEDDMENLKLPTVLTALHEKLFALTTEVNALHEIRKQRRPGSRYASLQQCDYEIRQSNALYRRLNIPHINTVTISVEEISTKIIDRLSLNRRIN